MSTIPIQNLIIDDSIDIGLSADLSNGTYKTSSLTDLSNNVYAKISDLSSNVYTSLGTKQTSITASTNLVGIGTSITALNYNNITVNKPSYFPSDYSTTLANKPTYFPSDYSTTVANKPDLSVYAIKSNVDSSLNTIYTALTNKQNTISVTTPLIKDVSSNITIDLSAYPLKTYVDGSLNTINTTLTNKQNTITVTTPLKKDISNNLSIDLSGYTLLSSFNTLSTTVGTKENALTFSTPLSRSTNTIGIDLSSYLTSSTASTTYQPKITTYTLNPTGTATFALGTLTFDLSTYDTITARNTALSSYLPLAGGSMTGSINITSSGTNSLIFDNVTNNKKIQLNNTNGIGVATNGLVFYTSGGLTIKDSTLSTTLYSVDSAGSMSTNGTIYPAGGVSTDANIFSSGTITANSFTEGGTALSSKYLTQTNATNTYALKTYVDGSLNTINTTLSNKQNTLTFSNPLLNTSNTISFKYNSSQFNIDASGNLNLTSSTSTNASNITSGILSVSYGGTGSSTLTAGRILIGNGTSSLLQSANLTWDITNNRLGIGLTNPGYPLEVLGNINCQEIYRNGTPISSTLSNFLTTSGGTLTGTLTGTTISATNLTATNLTGSGANITNLNVSNAASGTLAISRGGIGTTTLTAGQLLIGNAATSILQSSNLIWDNTNNRLGIGKTNPSYTFDVSGNINALTNININNQLIYNYLFNNTGGAHGDTQDFNAITTAGYKFVQNNVNSPSSAYGQYYSWLIGLGINYPVTGATSYSCQFAVPRGTPRLYMRYNEYNSWGSWGGVIAASADALTAGDKTITGSLTTTGNIYCGGNMGIGTGTPRANLDIYGNTTSMVIRGSNEGDSAILYLGTPFDANSAFKCAIIAQGQSTWSRSKLHFCLDNTGSNSSSYNASVSNSRMTIDYTGNVGIQNTNPWAALNLGNCSVPGSDGYINFGKYSTVTNGFRNYRIGFDPNFYFVFGDNGNGNSSANAWTGQLAIIYNAPYGSLSIGSSGYVTMQYGHTGASDERIKTNIKTIENALDKTLLLRGVNYNDIRIESDKLRMGLIAQEVELIIPEVVHTDEQTTMKSIEYQNIVGLLVEAIKEQQKQINDLKDILIKNNLS